MGEEDAHSDNHPKAEGQLEVVIKVLCQCDHTSSHLLSPGPYGSPALDRICEHEGPQEGGSQDRHLYDHHHGHDLCVLSPSPHFYVLALFLALISPLDLLSFMVSAWTIAPWTSQKQPHAWPHGCRIDRTSSAVIFSHI